MSKKLIFEELKKEPLTYEELSLIFKNEDLNSELVEGIITEVIEALKERGYDPTQQIVGYLMSGDPGYISSYQDARKKITSVDRSLILEFLIKKTLGE